MTCQWCGAPLPAGARFCPNCGSPVEGRVDEQAVDEASLDVAERKVVTVLFADLARSTELANMLDPERFRDLLSTFYSLVSRELASLRGRAEKFAGDAVMAVFGLPHAHEDDALRAVRAGLIIRDRTAKLGGCTRPPLRARFWSGRPPTSSRDTPWSTRTPARSWRRGSRRTSGPGP